MAPIVGAVKKTQRCGKLPDTTVGVNDLAGFFEAPQIGPGNIAFGIMVLPIASPANTPCSFEPELTLIPAISARAIAY